MYIITVHTKYGKTLHFHASEGLLTCFKGWLVGGHSGQEEETAMSMGMNLQQLNSIQIGGVGLQMPVAEAFLFPSGSVLRANIDAVEWTQSENVAFAPKNEHLMEEAVH